MGHRSVLGQFRRYRGRLMACAGLALAGLGACLAEAAITGPPEGLTLDPVCSAPEPALSGAAASQICYGYPGGEAPGGIAVSRLGSTSRASLGLPVWPLLAAAAVLGGLFLLWLLRRRQEPSAPASAPRRPVSAMPRSVPLRSGSAGGSSPQPEPLPLAGEAAAAPAAAAAGDGNSTLPPPSRGVGLASREAFEAQVPAGRLEELWKLCAIQPTRALEQLEALLHRAPEDPRLLHAVCLMRSKACQTSAAASLATIAIPLCLKRGEMRLAAEIFADLLPHVRELGLDYRQLVTIGYSLEQMRDRPRAAHAFARALRLEPAAEPAGEGLLRVAEYLASDPGTASQARGIAEYLLQYGEHERCLRQARELSASCSGALASES